MSPKKIKLANDHKPVVLIVDDQYLALRSLPRLISPEVFTVVWVPDEHQGLKTLKDQAGKVRIIIIDLKSSGMGGGGFLQQARQIAPQAAILITAPLGPFLYQEGIFYDFSGPNLKQDINAVLLSIAQEMGIAHGPEKNKPRPRKIRERFGVIIGRSQGINEVYRLIDNLKDSCATVLIQGESGTGKELVAQTIHQTSTRRNHPFVAVNCGAIPANLIESELFGHERGAFTTAMYQRKGKFEIAHGGTLFLDEIGELDRELQVKLLRVLQEKEFQRVGGNRSLQNRCPYYCRHQSGFEESRPGRAFPGRPFLPSECGPHPYPALEGKTGGYSTLAGSFFQKICRRIWTAPHRCLPRR